MILTSVSPVFSFNKTILFESSPDDIKISQSFTDILTHHNKRRRFAQFRLYLLSDSLNSQFWRIWQKWISVSDAPDAFPRVCEHKRSQWRREWSRDMNNRMFANSSSGLEVSVCYWGQWVAGGSCGMNESSTESLTHIRSELLVSFANITTNAGKTKWCFINKVL